MNPETGVRRCASCVVSMSKMRESTETGRMPQAVDDDEALAVHRLLDAHGIDRANRAEGNASRVYTLSERVLCVLRERDRAVQAEELLRVSHKNAVERARKLGEHMDNIVGVM